LLVGAGSAAEVAPALLSEALAKGGRDNVSIIVVDIDPSRRSAQRGTAQPLLWLKRFFKR
jgi:serine/threonine protein phosphatase PrpC